MLQEIHFKGNFITYLPKGQLMIHHGPESQPKQGAKGGIAIILSPEMAKTWIKSRSIMRYGGDSISGTTKLLSVDFKIKTFASIKTKSKFKHLNISLLVSYHPTSAYTWTKMQMISFIK